MKNLYHYLFRGQKTSKSVALFFILFSLFLLDSNSFAQQLTQGITYQGKLVENGLPFTGSQTIFFELIDNAGNIPWSETQTVNVQDGLYSVILGNQIPLPSSVFTANPNLNLRVTINGNVLSPNVPLRATPYAHSAGGVIRNSIGTLQILDGTILPADIASGGNDKLLGTNLTGQVTWLDRATAVSASGTAGGDLTGTYPNPKIAKDSVDSDNILDGTVATIDLANNSVTTDKIVNATIKDEDIAGNAAILGTKVVPDFGTQDITTTGDIDADELNLTGEANIVGDVTMDSDLDVDGDVNIVGKATSASTVGGANGDPANTLTTKDYVDTEISNLATSTSSLSNGTILIGNVSNTATEVAVSGDATLDNTGLLIIEDDAVTTNKLGTAGATDANKVFTTDAAGNPQLTNISTFSSSTLNNANIYVGNTSNVAAGVALSGDAILANTGALTISPNAVTSAKIADGTIADIDISGTANINGAKLLNSTITLNKLQNGTANQVFATNGTGNPVLLNQSIFNQNLSFTGNTFTLSGTPASSFTLSSITPSNGQVLTWNSGQWQATTPATFTNTDNQTLSLTGTNPTTRQITISGGNFLDININDADFDITNEIQNIAIAGNSIGITGGSGFNLTPSPPVINQVLTWNGSTWIAQTLPPSTAQTLLVAGGNLSISGGNNVTLGSLNTGQQNLSFVGNSIGIANGTGFNLTPVAPANGDVLTWNNTATRWEAQTLPAGTPQTLSVGGGNLSISGGNNVTLGSLNTGQQNLSIATNTLSIANGNSITLPNYTAGTNINFTGTYPNFTINATGGSPTYTAGTGINIASNVISLDPTPTLTTDTNINMNGNGYSLNNSSGTFTFFSVNLSQGVNASTQYTDAGGNIFLSSGDQSTTRTGGRLFLSGSSNDNGGGAGNGGSGDVRLSAGNADLGAGGAEISLGGGNTVFGRSNGGEIFIIAGDANGAIPASVGGNIFIQSGRRTSDNVYSEITLQNNGGNVGIGTSPTGGFRLDVNGLIRTTGAVNTTSDRRLKENILTLNNSLSNIQKLRGTSYFLKDKSHDERLQFGVIAQEIEEVFPNLVMTDSKGYKSVSYSGFIPVLIEATKEQQTIIEAQQEKISKLETQVQELKELVLLLKDENDSNSTLSKKVDALEKQLTSLVNQLSELTAQK